jgi:hypothetical protein
MILPTARPTRSPYIHDTWFGLHRLLKLIVLYGNYTCHIMSQNNGEGDTNYALVSYTDHRLIHLIIAIVYFTF